MNGLTKEDLKKEIKLDQIDKILRLKGEKLQQDIELLKEELQVNIEKRKRNSDRLFYTNDESISISTFLDCKRFADLQGKTKEFEILVGLKNYKDFVEMCSKEYDTLRSSVLELRQTFEDYYIL